MLSAMVACNPTVGREVLAKLDLDHDNFQSLVRRRNKDSVVDVRTSYVHFMLSFLVSGGASLSKDFLDKKTNFAQVRNRFTTVV